MININSNITDIVLKLTTGLSEIKSDKILRVVAQSMVTVVHDRIHEEGKDANNSQIGEYSNSYLKLRTKKYNRSEDKKVVLSLTRQEENDFSIQPTNDGYGLGYTNEENFKKSQWAEKRYNKKISDLTTEEKELVVKVAEHEVNRLLNG